jgi:hypothetical protein
MAGGENRRESYLKAKKRNGVSWRRGGKYLAK